MASASDKLKIKEIVLAWVRLITRNDRYYMAKAMDLFYQMEQSDQKALLGYFADLLKNPQWESKLGDSTQYASVIRSILFYYSGRKELSQPNKEEFSEHLGKFVRVAHKTVLKKVEAEEKEDFSTELGAI